MSERLKRMTEILHKEECSCVVEGNGGRFIGRSRGVSDLWRLLRTNPEVLDGATVADKVVGKGAAAIMAVGNVAEVYADVISRHALELLEKESISIEYGNLVPDIVNRAGTGLCPVETLCRDCTTPGECIPKIEIFINNINNTKHQ